MLYQFELEYEDGHQYTAEYRNGYRYSVFWTAQLQIQQNSVTLSYSPLTTSYTTVIQITKSWYPLYPHISPFRRFFRSIRTLKKRFYSLKLHLYLRGSRDTQQTLNITFFRYREEYVNLADVDIPGSNRKNRKSLVIVPPEQSTLFWFCLLNRPTDSLKYSDNLVSTLTFQTYPTGQHCISYSGQHSIVHAGGCKLSIIVNDGIIPFQEPCPQKRLGPHNL